MSLDKKHCQILEFRLSYDAKNPIKSTLVLIGMKVVLFAKDYPAETNLFYPIFDEEDNITGTQWLVEGHYIKLDNF